MLYGLTKFVTTMANFALIWLTWRYFTGELDWNMAAGALTLSGFWLVFTGLRLNQLFSTYTDVISRLQVILPLWTGLLLAALAALVFESFELRVVAGVEVVAWLGVYALYLRNKRRYKVQGHGPLPKDAWINPPVEAIPDMALLLFSGRIAARVHESVGHGEVAITMPNGKRMAFSSYMEEGAVLKSLAAVTEVRKERGHYIALRLVKPVPTETIIAAQREIQSMLDDNARWRERTNAWRKRLVNSLPLPKRLKSWLLKRVLATGYDWPGLLIGTRAANRWTCIGACLELYTRLGIKVRRYGTGILGMGTGLLNPIMPIRFLSDPAFELLTTADEQRWTASQRTSQTS